MKASDKDFDQLFNSKLGDMEVEPSANVWNNIANELDGKKEKGGLPFMKIAAGIVLLMAVGLFFIRPEHQIIALHPAFKATGDSQGSRVIAPIQPSVDYTESPVIAETKPSVKHRQSGTTVSHAESVVAKSIDTAQSESRYIAAVNQKADNQTIDQVHTIQAQSTGLVPDNIGRTAITKSTNVLTTKNANPVIASLNATKPEPTKKHKIHSLGDLLNVVIAKVDKREDKLIEFTNTSDDDSFNVTGVNLGLLKAKKDK
ncbi:MAG: hypothetical protein ABIN91_22350 [Mucilaginibacter sp.]|uniref:hypothetical protein n=1 Tax=Mucilaginibacter sp. TaxID=1882438 RepID=UPI0032663297